MYPLNPPLVGPGWRWIVIKNRRLRLIAMLLPGPDLKCAGSLARWRFSQNKCWPKIKSYHLSAGLWHCAIWITSWLLHYVFKKVRWEPEVTTPKIKTPNFSQVIHFNWLAKIKLRGPGHLVLNIIVNYRCTHVLLYAKNAKKYWNWRNNRLFSHFYHWSHFNWRGRGFPTPILAAPMSRDAWPE